MSAQDLLILRMETCIFSMYSINKVLLHSPTAGAPRLESRQWILEMAAPFRLRSAVLMPARFCITR